MRPSQHDMSTANEVLERLNALVRDEPDRKRKMCLTVGQLQDITWAVGILKQQNNATSKELSNKISEESWRQCDGNFR